MGDAREVLLLGDRGALEACSARLPSIGFRGRHAASLAEVEQLLGRYEAPVHACLLPTTFAFDGSALALERIRDSAAGERLRLLAIGPEPDERARDAMRRHGVKVLLAEPFADSELRFFLNQACWPAARSNPRGGTRVPTDLVAHARSAAGRKPALVFSLSAAGAYLDTARPSQRHAHVDLELPLPGSASRLRAQVVFANVTGNLMRSNLPAGMGVRFEEVPDATRSALTCYVEERAARYRP